MNHHEEDMGGDMPENELTKKLGEEVFRYFEAAEDLRGQLDKDMRSGKLIMKDDVDLVLQNYDMAVALSNDPVVRAQRAEFLIEHPSAGKK